MNHANDGTPQQRPSVAHVAACYYHLTENWIHTQVVNQSRYGALVLTLRTTPSLTPVERAGTYALLEDRPWVHLVNRLCRRLLGYYPAYRAHMRRAGARLIHAHFGQQGWNALALARNTKVPLITTFYGGDASALPRIPKWRERLAGLFRQGALFLVEGPYLGKQLEALGCPASKIRVQHLGVDLDQAACRPRVAGAAGRLRVLAAGRFTEKKGLEYAVEAVALSRARGVDCGLTIVGDATDKAEHRATKERILRAIERTGGTQHVELAGLRPLDELRRMYTDHDVFLAPSVQGADGDNEGGAPVTVTEACASGMCVIGSTHCDIPEVILNGETGLLCPERDAAALAAAIVRAANEPGLRLKLGGAARARVEAEYDARKQAGRLEAIYDSVLAAGANG